jgi:hypothetical protein
MAEDTVSDEHNQQRAMTTVVRATGTYPWGPGTLQPYTSPGTDYIPPQKTDHYANRVVVDKREHDATLKFFRDGKRSGEMVAEITVPLALLDKLVEALR